MKAIAILLPLLLLAAIGVAMFYKILFFGEIFYYGDNYQLNAPMKSLLVNDIKQGILALWDPYLFIGMPYFADLNLGTFYPFNIIYLILSPIYAMSLIVFIDILIISIAMYIFLKEKKFSTPISVFGGILFAYSGEVFQYINNLAVLNEVIYIPLIYLLLERFKKSGKLSSFLFLVVVQTFQVISGHPQVSYLTILFILAELIYLGTSWKRKIIICMFYVVFPLLLGSIQLVPFGELILLSNRIGNTVNSSVGKLSASSLLTFIFPNFWGSLKDGTWWGKQSFLLGYMGIPIIILLLLNYKELVLKHKKLITLVFFSFLLAWGFPLINLLIPGLVLFRDYSLSLIFYSFYITILACLSLKMLIERKIIISTIALVAVGLLMILMIGLYACWNLYYPKAYMIVHASYIIKAGLSKLAQFQLNKFHFIIGNIIWQAIIALTFSILVLVLLYVKNRLSKGLFVMIMCCLLMTNLFMFDMQIMLTAPIANFNFPNKKSIQSLNEMAYRIVTLPVDFNLDRNRLPGKSFFLNEAMINTKLLRGDTNMFYAENQLEGYSSLVPRNYARYVGSLDITGISFPIDNIKMLNENSVKIIAANHKVNLPGTIPLSTSSNFYVYKKLDSKPRIYAVNCTNCIISNTVYGDNFIKFQIKTPMDHTSIINTDEYYPGWKAYEDGHEILIKSYKDVFRQITVTKGEHAIVFSYEPSSIKLGLGISIISLFLLIYLLKREGERKLI